MLSNVPELVVLSGHDLIRIREALHENPNATLSASLADLTEEADFWLKNGPWTVAAREHARSFGDAHDYVSQAPYWWPPSTTTTHDQPYIRRDGHVNPEVTRHRGKTGSRALFRASLVLALAWFYTEEEAYANHAAHLLRTWFIDPETRMNPHLRHAQFIPGHNTGRAIGIIDFSQGYTSVLDAATILASGAAAWTMQDQKAFHRWNVEFLDWLQHSPFGVEESQEENNHGTFAVMQIGAIALFVGDERTVAEQAQVMKRRIDRCIDGDGSQPLELSRTRSWHYSCFHLLAFIRMAQISDKVGVDLWNHRGPAGQSLHTAVDYLILAATKGVDAWQYPELKFVPYAAADIIRASAQAGNAVAQSALIKLQTPPRGDYWNLRPAPEQLDNISVAADFWHGKGLRGIDARLA